MTGRKPNGPIALVALILWLASVAPSHAQDPHTGSAAPVEGVDFRVYGPDGTPASFADILSSLDGVEVVLVGEEHDDMTGHRFQAALFGAAWMRLREQRPIVLSLEMFERDVQYVLDEYLAGYITEDHFLASARPWDDYENRYRPLVEFARAHELPVVAANAPRRYVNRVSREGAGSLESLPESARRFLPPLPYPGPSEEYRAQWDEIMARAMQQMRASMDSLAAAEDASADGARTRMHGDDADGEGQEESAHAPAPQQHYAIDPNVIWSQALWDASMGEGVTSALQRHDGALVLHMAGAFHVAKGTGIPERIADYRPETEVLSIVMVGTEEVNLWSDEQHAGLGDYVVLTLKRSAQASPEPGEAR